MTCLPCSFEPIKGQEIIEKVLTLATCVVLIRAIYHTKPELVTNTAHAAMNKVYALPGILPSLFNK